MPQQGPAASANDVAAYGARTDDAEYEDDGEDGEAEDAAARDNHDDTSRNTDDCTARDTHETDKGVVTPPRVLPHGRSKRPRHSAGSAEQDMSPNHSRPKRPRRRGGTRTRPGDAALWPCPRNGVGVTAIKNALLAGAENAEGSDEQLDDSDDTWMTERGEGSAQAVRVAAEQLSHAGGGSASDVSHPACHRWVAELKELVQGQMWTSGASAFSDNSLEAIVERCQRSENVKKVVDFTNIVNVVQLAAKVST